MKKRGKVRKKQIKRKISTSSSRFRSIGIEVQPSTPEVEMSHRKKKRKRKRKKEKGKEKEKSCEKKFQARLAIFFFFFWKGVGRFTLMPSKGDAGQLPFGGRKWLSPWRHLKVWWSGVNLIGVRMLDDGDLLDKGKRRKRKRGC